MGKYTSTTPWRFMRLPLPFVEYWMPLLTMGELKVWLYIFRQSHGFKQPNAVLTHEQIAKGILRKDGKIQDFGTGLTVAGVRGAIRDLVNRGGLLHVTGTSTHARTYTVAWDLPVTVVAPKGGSACYSSNTQGDTVVTPKQAELIDISTGYARAIDTKDNTDSSVVARPRRSR